jgi:hypothetical protein
MRKAILFAMLFGCATEPSGPSQSALAVWSYFGSQCGYQGSDIVDGIKADPVLRGCVTLKVMQADTEWRRGQVREPNAIEGMGSVLESAGRKSQQNCTTRPDYLGGFTTTCY